MSATGRADPAEAADAGSTLLEMIVVIGIMVMATAIVFPNLRHAYNRLAMETSRAAVAADLRSARASAIRTDADVAFDVAADGRSYAWGGRRMLLPAAARLAGDPDRIVFAADGSSSGGRFGLTQSDGRSWWLEVDGPTGGVRLEPLS